MSSRAGLFRSVLRRPSTEGFNDFIEGLAFAVVDFCPGAFDIVGSRNVLVDPFALARFVFGPNWLHVDTTRPGPVTALAVTMEWFAITTNRSDFRRARERVSFDGKRSSLTVLEREILLRVGEVLALHAFRPRDERGRARRALRDPVNIEALEFVANGFMRLMAGSAVGAEGVYVDEPGALTRTKEHGKPIGVAIGELATLLDHVGVADALSNVLPFERGLGRAAHRVCSTLERRMPEHARGLNLEYAATRRQDIEVPANEQEAVTNVRMHLWPFLTEREKADLDALGWVELTDGPTGEGVGDDFDGLRERATSMPHLRWNEDVAGLEGAA